MLDKIKENKVLVLLVVFIIIATVIMIAMGINPLDYVVPTSPRIWIYQLLGVA